MERLLAVLVFLALSVKAGTFGDWQYSASSEGATITGYHGTGGAVKIPSEINGLYVKKIKGLEGSSLKGIFSVEIPKEITEVMPDVFMKCINLDKIEVAYENKNFSSEDGILYDKQRKKLLAFPPKNKEFKILPSVEGIGEFAFAGSRIREIKLEENINQLGEGAFANCNELIKVHLPSSLKKIESFTFSGCVNLNKVNLPASLEEIGESAFYGCKNLKEISLIKAPQKVGSLAFAECSPELTTIINEPLEGRFRDSKWLILLEIRGSKVVEKNAFRDCSSLKKVILEEGVQEIQYGAFRDCISLEEVVLPKSMLSIGSYAFSGCTKLFKINIPVTCAEIDSTAFEGCQRVANDFGSKK